MRAQLLSLLFIASAFAGCASTSDAGDPAPASTGLDANAISAPVGGRLNQTLEGVNIELPDVSLPYELTFAIPEGATMVRFVADPGAGATVGVAMWHSDTGRRRCNQQSVVDLGSSFFGPRSCSSIAALDAPGTNWTARATGPAKADLRVEFLSRPVDGVAGMLDLGQLSHATHDLRPTEYLEVPSFDGTALWVELTLPEGEGPWPTIIASSPYNGEKDTASRGIVPAMWRYWTQDWAKRGYAAINVDVRGYGMSGGCVEIWGINEQLDQKYIVEWAGRQPWSDGHMGFYGQSYVGTTPVEAAIHQAKGLDAIIAVAPVINAYEDWHYGGVPNGESSLSPVAYQVLTATPEVPSDPTQPTDLASMLAHAGDGVCDPDIVVGANDPRAVYNDFYAERDFKQGAADIEAAVLFTEGFEDANVKSAMIPGWFNELTAPKLGVFGHWLHQHPARMDQEVLFLGWMDQYVKGKDIGFDRIPNAVINVDNTWHRTTDSWPTNDATDMALGLDFAAGGLGTGTGTAGLVMQPAPDTQNNIPDDLFVLRAPIAQDTPWINGRLHLEGNFVGENGFVYARVDELRADGSSRLISYGMLNLALRNGYDSYEPAAGQISGDLPFRPTEHILGAGSTLVLTLRGVQAGEAVGLAQPQPAVFQIDGAASALIIPTLSMDAYEPLPISARP